MLMDVEIKKLETKIAQACRVDRMKGQDMGSDTIELEDCRPECVALLPWLRPHLTKQSNQGSTSCKEERAAMTVARVIEGYL